MTSESGNPQNLGQDQLSPDPKTVKENWKASLVGPIFGVLVGLLCIRSYPHPGAFVWGALGLFSLCLLIQRIAHRPKAG